MPSKKPLLSGRIDPELKNAFAIVAKEQGVTEARLLEIVVAAFLRHTPPPFQRPSRCRNPKVSKRKTCAFDWRRSNTATSNV